MVAKFETHSIDDLKEVASEIAEKIKSEQFNIILFHGAMGAGKTTLIKYLCHNLGVTDVVTSPTFSLINEYSTSYSTPIFHFDLYRIESIDELYDMGYEEYFYSSNLCLIEWPEKAEQIIPYDDPSIKIGEITINVLSASNREVVFDFHLP